MFDEGLWSVATTFGTEAEATLAQGFLESHGVASRVESRAFRQEPVNFGALGLVRLWVPPADLERARTLIADRHRITLVADEEGDEVALEDAAMDDEDLRRENG